MTRVKILLHDFARAFYAPRSLYADMHAGRATPSWACVLVYCLIYVIACFWLYFSGHEPFTEPWIMLDKQTYYFAEAFYLTPLIFQVWIMGAGTIHVLSRLLGGTGNFDTSLKMTGYSFWAPLYLVIIVDSIHATPEWLYNLVIIIAMILVISGTSIAVKIEHSMGWFRSVPVAVVTIAALGAVLFTYVR